MLLIGAEIEVAAHSGQESGTIEGMRSFNTAGPVVSQDHYCIPPLERVDLEFVLRLIRGKKYFLLRAPRQTGKTSVLLTLQDLLNGGGAGTFRCLYLNVETGQAAGEDVHQAIRSIIGRLASCARRVLKDDFVGRNGFDILERFGAESALEEVLTQWAEADPRPLIVLIDEIDALAGNTLLSVLRQLRSGYYRRPEGFPHGVVLCGVRDLRDFPVHSDAKGKPVMGGSAFNISAASLRLGDFSPAEVETLLAQHTTETGQAFRPEALARIWAQTRGQPWLVNALCDRVCFWNERGRDRSRAITEDDILEAQEQIILGRVVHLDQLANRLQEDRVRRVVEPLLSGSPYRHYTKRDLEYVRDLGLIACDAPLRMANPIYAEVVPRELTSVTQDDLTEETAWYVGDQGQLDLPRLLTAFQEFYRQNSEHWLDRYDYKEAGPQLLLQAFLQRIVNGGGRIEREYGLGLGRTDLLVIWPWKETTSRFVIECKVLRQGLESTIRDGVEQTAGYMDRCGAEAGHLVIFDRGTGRWADKVFRQRKACGDVAVEVWGM